MKKYAYLIKNIGLLTVSNFSSKLLSFFLIPLYTSVLTTEDYGTYDIFNTTIMLLLPILTIGLIESVLRFPLSERNRKEEIFVIGIKYLFLGFTILVIICTVNYFLSISTVLKKYGILFLAMYFTAALSQLLQNYARGVEEIKSLSISGVLSSMTVIVLNVLFLLFFNWGLIGYFLANIIGMIVTIFYLIVKLDIWKYNFFYFKLNKTLEKRMIDYGGPTIANSISWWVNNAADRYIIIGLFGIATNGVYSVGYKIPSIMSVFQTIFNQAWTISAVQEFDKNDSSGFYKNIYRMTNFFMVILCSLLIVTTKLFAFVLYKNQFYDAWKYVPFLLISVLFGSLCGVLSGVFIAVKNTKNLGITTVAGAIINIVFGIVFSLVFGPIGAALGTSLSYIVVWLTRLIYIKRYMTLKIRLLRDTCSYIILFLQSLLMIVVKENSLLYTIQLLLIVAVLLINKSEIVLFIKKLLKKNR